MSCTWEVGHNMARRQRNLDPNRSEALDGMRRLMWYALAAAVGLMWPLACLSVVNVVLPTMFSPNPPHFQQCMEQSGQNIPLSSWESSKRLELQRTSLLPFPCWHSSSGRHLVVFMSPLTCWPSLFLSQLRRQRMARQVMPSKLSISANRTLPKQSQGLLRHTSWLSSTSSSFMRHKRGCSNGSTPKTCVFNNFFDAQTMVSYHAARDARLRVVQ
jgi:hypothetical protein